MARNKELPTDLYADPAMEKQYQIAGMLYLHLPRQAQVINDTQGTAALWLGQAPELDDTVPLIAYFKGSNGYWYGNVPSNEVARPNGSRDFDIVTLGASILHYAEFETESAMSAIGVLAGNHVLEAAEERYKRLRVIAYAMSLLSATHDEPQTMR